MVAGEERNRRWVRSAFEGALTDVRCAGSGARNESLLRAACRAFVLSNTLPGELGRGEVVSRLLEAADTAGLPPREARAVLKSAEKRTDGEFVREQLPCPYSGARWFEEPASRRVNLSRLARPKPQREQWRRPPAGEVEALWRSGEPAPSEVLANLSGKPRPGIVPDRLADADLVRVLPNMVELPDWAKHWRHGHRVIVQAFDPTGAWVTLRARTAGLPPGDMPKEYPPRGFEVGGAVLACPLARRMLAGDDDAAAMVRANGLVLTEGTPSWLAWASRYSDADESAPAVIGYCTGAWTGEHAATVPTDTRVVIDPDRNDAGRRMMAHIAKTLRDRARVEVTKERANG